MTCVNGDSDTLLEVGEKYIVDIDFTDIPNARAVELRPSEGAGLSIN